MSRSLSIRTETWPLAAAFTISRGSRTETATVLVELTEGSLIARGEAVPNTRYDETPASVTAEIEAVRGLLEQGASREVLNTAMKHGAARNAVDCALWDLEAKRAHKRVWQLAGLEEPGDVTTVYTISLGTPDGMGTAAAVQADRPILKLKLGGIGDVERVAAVRKAAPNSRLVVDANEAWTPELFPRYAAALAGFGVELIEQPLPAGQDAMLGAVAHPVPICADESFHDRAGLDEVAKRYDYINLKLDKSGGLTEGLAIARAAKERGLGLMVGCMVGTSLGMAPAHLVANLAQFVDIDAPLLLAQDRAEGLVYKGSVVAPPSPKLWG